MSLGEQQCPQSSLSARVMENPVSILQVQEAGGTELMHVSCSALAPRVAVFVKHRMSEPLQHVTLDLLEMERIIHGNQPPGEGLGGREELFKESWSSAFLLQASLCLFHASERDLELQNLSSGLPQ